MDAHTIALVIVFVLLIIIAASLSADLSGKLPAGLTEWNTAMAWISVVVVGYTAFDHYNKST